jgi:hypothetical protein
MHAIGRKHGEVEYKKHDTALTLVSARSLIVTEPHPAHLLHPALWPHGSKRAPLQDGNAQQGSYYVLNPRGSILAEERQRPGAFTSVVMTEPKQPTGNLNGDP